MPKVQGLRNYFKTVSFQQVTSAGQLVAWYLHGGLKYNILYQDCINSWRGAELCNKIRELEEVQNIVPKEGKVQYIVLNWFKK